MYRYFLILTSFLLLTACDNPVKDEQASVVVEPGAETTAPVPSPASSDSAQEPPAAPPAEETPATGTSDDVLGNWVGYFEKEEDDNYDKVIHVDEGFYWNRANKINISLDAIRGDSVFGHSVVAGNDRPFRGVRKDLHGKYRYQVQEPGDDRYDGTFEFTVEDGLLSGTWTAYKDIDIKHRVYDLEPRTFSYNPAVMLNQNRTFIDWTKKQETKETFEEDGEVLEWITQTFASTTNDIYQINASTQRLTKAQVENLKKGDLTIIRNAIYARHGYSFKNRPLRVFFDAQPWYIPVHADIRADFTELEKENIQLLLRYEENAAEYYDYFGRG